MQHKPKTYLPPLQARDRSSIYKLSAPNRPQLITLGRGILVPDSELARLVKGEAL